MIKWLMIGALIVVPGITHANVIINEIAWMGTEVSANDEWIELYNTSSSSVTLDGWTLRADDGAPEISLFGVIAANGYFLLERSDDNSAPPSADLLYTGGLGNDGESIVLRDLTDTIIDTVSFASGWPAGDNTTKETMQRIGTAWQTGTATPRAANVTNTGSSNDYSPSSSTSQSISTDPKYSASIEIPDYVTARSPTSFVAQVQQSGSKQGSGLHVWNFGDGDNQQTWVERGKIYEVNHTYAHPGTYSVSFQYFANNFESTRPSVAHRQSITVHEPNITVTESDHRGFSITNDAAQDINLSQWVAAQAGTIFTIPDETVILAGSSITVPNTITQFSRNNGTITLRQPDGYFVATSYQETQNHVESNHQTGNTANEIASTFITPVTNETVSLVSRSDAQQFTLGDLPVIPILFIVVSIIAATVLISYRIRKKSVDTRTADSQFEYIKIRED